MLDIYAPIVPYIGAGGFRLYSYKPEVDKILENVDVKVSEYGKELNYTIGNYIELAISKVDDQLFRITTLPDYKGKLFGSISSDTTEEEFLQIEPSFVYNDFEEIYKSPKGVTIETDVFKHTASWITIFIKELY